MQTSTVALSCAMVLLALAGCGQKGPLYLPDKGGEVITRPTGQRPQSPQSPETGAPQNSTNQPNSTNRDEEGAQPRS